MSAMAPEIEVQQSDDRLELTARISAPADAIFAIVADPRRHVDIDGSGMLVSTAAEGPFTAVGDSFVVNMDRESLGDIPLGKYTVRNTVTRLEPGRLVEWNVGGVDQPPYGHVYGYLLMPIDAHTTLVTLYCDWSAITDDRRQRFPVVPATMLQKSLVNLDRIATASSN
jgi:hypothetical protein